MQTSNWSRIMLIFCFLSSSWFSFLSSIFFLSLIGGASCFQFITFYILSIIFINSFVPIYQSFSFHPFLIIFFRLSVSVFTGLPDAESRRGGKEDGRGAGAPQCADVKPSGCFLKGRGR